MRYLLDTSALLSHYRHETGWESVQHLFEKGEAEIFLASVSLAEFARRLHDLGAPDEEVNRTVADYEMLFSTIVPIDARIAKEAYVIGRLASARLPMVDALIAAAAQRYQAILVHRDRHMTSISTSALEQIYLGIKAA